MCISSSHEEEMFLGVGAGKARIHCVAQTSLRFSLQPSLAQTLDPSTLVSQVPPLHMRTAILTGGMTLVQTPN